jgi:signal transduction histidine kinase/DNA-binding response OmpR family regulator
MAQVVIVDDELNIREVFAYWLEEAGHNVFSAGSVEVAQDLLKRGGTDVLLTDIRLARQDTGIDLLQWTRQFDRSISVVVVTGYPEVSTAVDALRLEAFDYLLKPVDSQSLLHTVEQAASHSQLLREKLNLETENQRYQRHLEDLVAERAAMLQRRTQQLMLLHWIITMISALKEEPKLYRQVVETVRTTLGHPMVAIYEIDPTNSKLILRARSASTGKAIEPGYQLSVQSGLVGRAAREQRIVVVNDVQADADYVACGAIVGSEAVFPILVNGDLQFLLDVSEQRPNAFDDTDVTVLQTLAEHLGVALANSQLYAQLKEALAVREQILQNVSHELRTPLTLIGGYAEFLLETLPADVPGSAVDYATTIVEQTVHLAHLVNQLVMFQTVEREKSNFETVDLEEWLHGMVDMWRPILANAGLTLASEFDTRISHVFGHWDYLTQVMQNLLDNAQKFSPAGGIVTVRSWRQNGEVLVSISDQGIGVEPEKLPFLFERFYQADSGVTRRFGGMGLGLALVREIILKHDGRLWAHSEGEGSGLTITFALPLVAPDGSQHQFGDGLASLQGFV